MPWKRRNTTTFKRSMVLEYLWLKNELINLASGGVNECSRCHASDDLQLHHLDGSGDVKRTEWKVGTATPHMLGYYYEIYFEFRYFPDRARMTYGVLCGRCNKLDHHARRALKKGMNLKKTKKYDQSNIVLTNPEIKKPEGLIVSKGSGVD